MKMKIFISILSAIITVAGCRQRTDKDIINSAVIHFSGIFITENIQSSSSLRIEGNPVVKKKADGAFYISGTLEGFSPVNYPVSIKNFNETLYYTGGDPNERKNWICKDIYIGNKKMK